MQHVYWSTFFHSCSKIRMYFPRKHLTVPTFRVFDLEPQELDKIFNAVFYKDLPCKSVFAIGAQIFRFF